MGDLLLFICIAAAVYLLVRSVAQRQQGAETGRGERTDRRAPSRAAAPPRAHAPPVPPPMSARATRSEPGARWVPAGEPVTVGGRTIERGMLYVGRDLGSPRGWGTENALVDPALRVAPAGAAGGGLPYWPSYREFTPAQRGTYLDWLAGGASGAVDTGYVFLYFYGLERRYFYEPAPSDADAVLDEVRRLRKLYGRSASFDRYAGAFVEAAACRSPTPRRYDVAPDLERAYEPRLSTKVALGQAAADGEAVPPDWLLQWLLEDVETRLRTPAERCREELRALFGFRIREAYPEGFRVKPNKTPLKAHYRAASGGFEVALGVGGLPDVTKLRRPLHLLQAVLDACTDELDAYSRYLGRHPGARGTRAAVALLPAPLVEGAMGGLDDPFAGWVRERLEEAGWYGVEGGELAERWVGDERGRLTKGGGLRRPDAEALAAFLDRLGVGVEPDPRLAGGAFSVGKHAVLFRRAEAGPVVPSEVFERAALVLTLVAAVAHADRGVGERERDHLFEHVRGGGGLSAAERERLEARLHHLLLSPPSLRGLTDAVAAGLPAEAREGAARLALLTAVADGRFDPAEERVLQKVYEALGLDPAALYGDLHALGADRPPSVRAPRAGAPGYALPRPTEPVGDGGGPVVRLDMALVSAKLADTKRASALLSAVFTETADGPLTAPDEPAPASSTATGAEGRPLTATSTGLDPAHAALLEQLLTRAEWPRPEYEAAAAALHLMPDGALETINEWAFERLDDALVEDGDPLTVYLDLWNDYAADA